LRECLNRTETQLNRSFTRNIMKGVNQQWKSILLKI
jgi:hypothetical protein